MGEKYGVRDITDVRLIDTETNEVVAEFKACADDINIEDLIYKNSTQGQIDDLVFKITPTQSRFKINMTKVTSLEDVIRILGKTNIVFFGEDAIKGIEDLVEKVD